MFDNDRGMTGLESAVVLIAFVVVASVFAYVVLGSGFFTAQKSKEVIYGAVDQVSSSMLTGGSSSSGIQSEVSAQGNHLITISISLKLPPYSSPVDLSRTTARLITNQSLNSSVFFPEQSKTVIWVKSNENPPDMLLETGELVELRLTDLDIPPATRCTIEVMPPQGMHQTISVTTPK
ncbi:MAG: archaellin/type IV pilin N-terminal domain-containing protein [Methanocella sp.]